MSIKKITGKVLLAEDDEFLQRMYVLKLTAVGIEVVVAADGDKALELITREKPALVLLDVLMPKRDGFSVLEAMRKDETLKKIPVIMLTNMSEPEDVKRARRAGVSDYLIKSHFLPSEVVTVVKQYIDV